LKAVGRRLGYWSRIVASALKPEVGPGTPILEVVVAAAVESRGLAEGGGKGAPLEDMVVAAVESRKLVVLLLNPHLTDDQC